MQPSNLVFIFFIGKNEDYDVGFMSVEDLAKTSIIDIQPIDGLEAFLPKDIKMWPNGFGKLTISKDKFNNAYNQLTKLGFVPFDKVIPLKQSFIFSKETNNEIYKI